ncbi:MAG: two-component system response regulator GlrR [Rhodocyclaceae bacterium]
MVSPLVLVVDDDPDLLQLIAMRLGSAGYAVETAASGEEALARFRARRPRVVLSDLRMEGMDGHALFARLHELAPGVPVIILTAHGTIPEAVAATQRGVFSFLTKPFDARELLDRVGEAVAMSPPVAAREGTESAWREEIVGESGVMEELLRQAYRAAAHDDPVLILGPPGCGRQALARAIHRASARARQPYRVLDPGLLPMPRIEEELHALSACAAARTPAARDLGVLFVADLAALSPLAQLRLLAHAQPRAPLSSPMALRRADVRIIASAGISIETAVREGRLRADLYYGLAASKLVVPSLAERREDIPLLAGHFAARHAGAGRGRGFAPEAIALLRQASWPGNVRELETVVRQAMAESVTALVPASLVRRLVREEDARQIEEYDEARRAFERQYLMQLLASTGGNVARAARIAGRNRTEFYKLLARHGLDPAAFKDGSRR